MPRFDVDREYLNISPDEYLSECDNKEIRQLAEILINEGHIPPGSVVNPTTKSTTPDRIFDQHVLSLVGNRFKLSKKDEETIIKISKTL